MADAYDRRVEALHDAVTAWATARDVAVAPADSWTVPAGAIPDSGRYSVDLIRGDRRATVRLIPSWELEEVGDASVIVEDDSSGLRMQAFTGDSGMPTAAALKGLLTGLLFPEEPAH
ncbi:hypothetical protein [Nocardia paucivorans]|uniref:hypothetical protein n=1 Tax=Nocardia paucivorans TaxID=114259 RepID=UPI0002D34EA8|nr:hypothetical protein [Nocardia paucivorans]